MIDPRIKRQAEELGKLLADSDEYTKLQQARTEVQQRSATQIMLRDLQQKQEALQRKQMNGEEITQAEIADLQRISQMMSMNPYIRELYEAEMAFSGLIREVQGILFKPVGLAIPEEDQDEPEAENASTEEAESTASQEDAARQARSRLWVPGQ